MEDDKDVYFPVIIIGAGLSGLAAGCQLKEKLHFDQFRIFDLQPEPGGVWFSHQYPGVACDVPAALYSYSFSPNPSWSTLKPSGQEILAYLMSVCKKYKIMDNIQTNTEVISLQWDPEPEEWIAQAIVYPPSHSSGAKVGRSGGQSLRIRAKAVISAVGRFTIPKVSEIERLPGVKDFEGPIIHTAQWDKTVNLKGKNVIVVGTGCSAAQLVPKLVSPMIQAKSVIQLVRTPPWVAPALLSDRVLYLWETYMPWIMQHIPGVMWVVRFLVFAVTELSFFLFFRINQSAPIRREQKRSQLLDYMKREVPQRYHEIMTPQYDVGCKRLIHDSGWYSCLNNPSVQIMQMSLKQFQRRSVTLQTRAGKANSHACHDVEVPADAIILATGYDMEQQLLPTLRVFGRNGVELHSLWEQRGGAQAYLGLAVDGFPNLYFLLGPNSSSGYTSVLLGIENNLRYIISLLRPLLHGEIRTCEIRSEACQKWTQKVQSTSQKSVWMQGGCRNWYIADGKWNPIIYPFSHIYAMYCVMFPVWSHWSVAYTQKGYRHRYIGLIWHFRLVLLAPVVYYLWRYMCSFMAPNLKQKRTIS